MSNFDPCAYSRGKVRERFPDAECIPDGLMWVITINGGQKAISHRASATHRAWRSAAEYVAANAEQQPLAPREPGEGAREAINPTTQGGEGND